MTNTTTQRVLLGFCTLLTVSAFLAATAVAQTSTTTKTKGATTSTTRVEHGTVTYIDGNTVVAKMSTGEVRTVTVPDSRTAIIDGKEITVHDLKVGTAFAATITTTTTPVTERTVTNLTGTVWYVSGINVILTLPDGTNKMYKATSNMKFDVGGEKATVFDLRKGMKVSAEKITEEPKTEIASNTVITGHAPAPRPVVAKAPAPEREAIAAAVPAPARETAPAQAREATAARARKATPAPASAQVREAAAASSPTPASAPASAEARETAAASSPAPASAPDSAPAKLPKTGSPIPLAGMLGLLFTGAGLGLRRLRRP